MKIGLFFPLKTLATSDARRPNVCPVASTTYQSLVMVDGLAIKLFMSSSPPVYSLKINGSDMTSWLSGPSIISILLSQVYDKMHLGAFEITFYMHTTILYYITLFRVCQ